MFELGKDSPLHLSQFFDLLYNHKEIALGGECIDRLNKTRQFIDCLLENNVKIYGLTTGFADLRDKLVDPKSAAELSFNIIQSHDGGIGPELPQEVVLGAMIIRANSLAKGNSGFQTASLQTLVDMINARIIPSIPNTGSLGASGDLCFLSRLGRAMEGQNVPVYFKGVKTTAKVALEKTAIAPFRPKAKEGLALINGTSFMASMIAIAYRQQILEFENILASLGLFLNAVRAIDAAFKGSIQHARKQSSRKKLRLSSLNILKTPPSSTVKESKTTIASGVCLKFLGPNLKQSENSSKKSTLNWMRSQITPFFFKETKSPKMSIRRESSILKAFRGQFFQAAISMENISLLLPILCAQRMQKSR